jgi:IS30 family transposase
VSGRYLSFEEREEIAIHHANGLGVREIARRIDRDPSTVSRVHGHVKVLAGGQEKSSRGE